MELGEKSLMNHTNTNHETKAVNKSQKLESSSKDESNILHKQWSKGAYNFLLLRTLNKYSNLKTRQRREQATAIIKLDLPCITDEILLWLYQKAVDKHSQNCQRLYKDSNGYQDTPSEKLFKKTIQNIIKSNPEYRHLEVYPSDNHSKDLPPNQKMTISGFIPDFIVYGIKRRGCTAVCFEINGDSHVYKYEKDLQKEQKLESLGISTWPIENEQVADYKYIQRILSSSIKKRSGALDRQIKRNKRKIWAKTVSCLFSLKEIEELVRDQFGQELNLMAESHELLKMTTCPRIIKKELRNEM